ncbi:retrovirus-related pol polyprotein from transposon TNT 1-94, partial [Tanacetum coccineum]
THQEPIWYLESGCSRSMTGVKSYLHKYVEQPGDMVVFGDNSSCITEGYGSIKCGDIFFSKVAFVNGLKYNLISIIQLCYAKYIVQFDDKQRTIFNANKEIVLITPRRNDVYKLESFCDVKGISQNFSSPYTLVQNGVVERKNINLTESARTMFNGSLLSKNFWTKVVRIPCYTYDRSIIVKSKFDAKADDGYFLGYSFVSKAFKVFNTRRQQIEETFHVTFDESMEAIRFSNTSVDEIRINVM